jgi:hypothetical protein
VASEEEHTMTGRRRFAVGVGLVLSALAALAGGPGVRAAPVSPDAGGGVPEELKLVPPDALGFASLRVAEPMRGPLGERALALLDKELGTGLPSLYGGLGLSPTRVERLTWLALAPGLPPVEVIRTTEPYDRARLLRAFARDSREVKVAGKTCYVGSWSDLILHLVDDRTVLQGTRPGLEHVLAPRKKARKHPLADALTAAGGKHVLVAGVNPSALLRLWERGDLALGLGLYRYFGPRDPAVLPFKPLLEAHSALLTLDPGAESRLQLRVSFAGEQEARDGETAVKTALYVARELLPQVFPRMGLDPDGSADAARLLRLLHSALRAAPVERRRATVVASARLKLDTRGFATVALGARTAAQRKRSADNLKRLALALINFADANGGNMPASAIVAIVDREDKPLLSWRVTLLPYLGEGALFKQFKLDEPWDSPHNKKLLAKMPAVYAAPVRVKGARPYSTHYQVFTGPDTPFDPRAVHGKPPQSFGARYPATFTDGTANTILVVEAAAAVLWTKPADLAYDPRKPIPKLGGLFRGGFHGALADGVARFFRQDFDEANMRKLINPADGLPIQMEKVLPRWDGGR